MHYSVPRSGLEPSSVERFHYRGSGKRHVVDDGQFKQT